MLIFHFLTFPKTTQFLLLYPNRQYRYIEIITKRIEFNGFVAWKLNVFLETGNGEKWRDIYCGWTNVQNKRIYAVARLFGKNLFFTADALVKKMPTALLNSIVEL